MQKLVFHIRGHVSMMHICNATGVSLPPIYVFAGVELIHNMLQDSPNGKTHQPPSQKMRMNVASCWLFFFSC